MNRIQARKYVQEKYGPTANVVNVSSNNRNERFGVVYYAPAGALGDAAIGCLGYGDSYDSAISKAEQNEVAKLIAQDVLKAKADLEEFGKDPHAYLEKRKQEMMKLANDAGVEVVKMPVLKL